MVHKPLSHLQHQKHDSSGIITTKSSQTQNKKSPIPQDNYVMSSTKRNPTHCSKINIFGPRWLNIPLELPICKGTLSWNKTSTTILHPTNVVTTLRIQGRQFFKSLILSSSPLSSTLKAIATSYSNCCRIWHNENLIATTIRNHIAQILYPMFLNSKNTYLFLLPKH